MFTQQWSPLWLLPVESVSPITEVRQVPLDTKILMIVGSKDPVTPPQLTTSYAAALRRRGVAVAVVVLNGEAHNILLEPSILGKLHQLIETP
jgi:pimeloyl-ACP methyl ester carboxylesterase